MRSCRAARDESDERRWLRARARPSLARTRSVRAMALLHLLASWREVFFSGELLSVDLDAGGGSLGHAERLVPVGMSDDDVAVRALVLLPIATRRARSGDSLFDDPRTAHAEPVVQAFDARDVAPSPRALEDHRDVVLA